MAPFASSVPPCSRPSRTKVAARGGDGAMRCRSLHPTLLAPLAVGAFTPRQACRQDTAALGGPAYLRPVEGSLNWVSFVAAGRGWRHPTFTCKRPAPGRRARWLETRGPVPTGSGEAPAMVVEPRPAFSGSRPNDASLQRDTRTAKEWRGTQDAVDAGAERQPVGRATAPLSVAE